MKKEYDITKLIKFIKVEDDLKILDYADLMLEGIPICVNFSDCPEIYANKILYFLSGINYAIDGDYRRLNNKIFLFALKEHLKEPTMKEWVKKWSEK